MPSFKNVCRAPPAVLLLLAAPLAHAEAAPGASDDPSRIAIYVHGSDGYGKLINAIATPSGPLASAYLSSIFQIVETDGAISATECNYVYEFFSGDIALKQTIRYANGESVTIGGW